MNNKLDKYISECRRLIQVRITSTLSISPSIPSNPTPNENQLVWLSLSLTDNYTSTSNELKGREFTRSGN